MKGNTPTPLARLDEERGTELAAPGSLRTLVRRNTSRVYDLSSRTLNRRGRRVYEVSLQRRLRADNAFLPQDLESRYSSSPNARM